jgi:hemin uptake protein HemP
MPPLQALAMQDDSPRDVPLSPPRTDASAHQPPPADETRTIRSEEIFAGARVVLIQHADEIYRLMITRNNRLILQK